MVIISIINCLFILNSIIVICSVNFINLRASRRYHMLIYVLLFYDCGFFKLLNDFLYCLCFCHVLFFFGLFWLLKFYNVLFHQQLLCKPFSSFSKLKVRNQVFNASILGWAEGTLFLIAPHQSFLIALEAAWFQTTLCQHCHLN